ncbi:MAG TPA: hypothetical protein VIJ00_16225 [Nakamurella sp.]
MHSPTWPEVVRLPGFWIGCSMIFLVNAILSACFGQWPLATVQLGTAVMATAAAASARADDKASERTAVAGG